MIYCHSGNVIFFGYVVITTREMARHASLRFFVFLYEVGQMQQVTSRQSIKSLTCKIVYL